MMEGGDIMYYNTQQVLCEAIRGHHVVRFCYDGEMREVEPYVVFHASTGNTLLFCIQRINSVQAEPRYFNLNKVSYIETAGNFSPDQAFSTHNLRSCIGVICSVNEF